MANTKIPVELSSTPGIVDNSNATAITIDSSENVGIGTSNPSNALDVQTSAGKFSVEALGGGSVRLASNGSMGMNVASGFSYEIDVGGSEVMRITSGGNVGINLTDPQTYGGFTIKQQSNTSSEGIAVLDSTSAQSVKLWVDGTNSYLSSGNAGADPLILNTGGGNVGIGHTSPDVKLDVNGAIRTKNSSQAILYLNNISTQYAIQNNGNDLTIGRDGTERMRIAADGRVGIGETSLTAKLHIKADGGTEAPLRINNTATGTGNSNSVIFQRNGTNVGFIVVTGSTTAYNTSSDARLKDITGEARGLEVITKLNPVAYNWKADGKVDEGLIAQEVMDIVPNAVSGSEEEYYQMDYSKLVVHLVKGMKEQQEQIEALQSEINLLKGE